MTDARLDALRAWHRDLLESGRPAAMLPTDRDLQILSYVKELDRTVVPRLGLDRPDAVSAFFAGIKGVLRSVPPTQDPGDSSNSSSGAPGAGPRPAADPSSPGTARSARKSRMRDAEDRPAGGSGGSPASAGRPTPQPSDDSSRPRSNRPTEPPSNATSKPPSEGRSALPPFAPLDLTRIPDDAGATLSPITVTVDDVGTLNYSWAGRHGEGSVIYRVVTSDEYMPYSPESGELLVTTDNDSVSDRRPFAGPTRHITVWVNVGRDAADARRAQPQLLSQGTAVAPVTNVQMRVSEGIVTAEWSVHDSIRRVEVLRVPAAQVARRGYISRFRLHGVSAGQNSFRDNQCNPGERYQYRFFAVALSEGSEVLSEPVVRDVEVPAPVMPVLDLRARQYEEGTLTLVDLAWTPPTGKAEVRIYGTNAPHGAAPGMELAVDALPQAGLPQDARELQQPEFVDGFAKLEGVTWPADVPRLFLTAVTIRGGRACVGSTVALVRVGTITHIELVQRVNWQLLTFDWPLGAGEVQVYKTAIGVPPPQGAPPLVSIDRETYDAQGGLRVNLLQRGELGTCDLHLLPVSYNAGQAIAGQPQRVRYSGMLRLAYQLVEEQAEPTSRWSRTAPPSRWSLQLQSDQQRPPAFALALVMVYSKDRLPLDDKDGTAVLRLRVAPPALQPVRLAEFDHSRPGYYRLFVEPDPGLPFEIALIDPPLHSLLAE